MTTQLKHTVDTMSGLGFTGKYVGTRSICSSFVMALYLSKRAISPIMLLEQWCSDAFLLHVGRQVQEFSAGLSVGMVLQETCFTIPALDEQDQLDYRTRTPQSFANMISFNAPEAATEHVKIPAMHVWH